MICKKNKYAKQCPHKGNTINNIQEASTVGDVGRSIPRIYVTLDGGESHYQSRMIEVAGNIYNVPIFILIDSIYIHI